MRKSLQLLAATALGLTALGGPAAAQDAATATYGTTVVTIGGGGQFLSLPDIRFIGKGDPNNFKRQTNDEFSNYGWATGGAIETPLGFWAGYGVTGGIKGFWSNITDDDRVGCRASTCTVVDPTGTATGFGPPVLVTKTNRDVDYWGGQAEAKFWSPNTVQVKPNLYRNDYFIVGADIRGIDQDNKLHGEFEGDPIFKYKETLNTTYYGGYIGLGGEYSLGFLGVGELWDRLGLQQFISARAGLYDAVTDYDGRFAFQFFPFASKLSKSDDNLAFIGTVSFETRKQLGPRTSLSLFTDYEYISSVPKMRYADGNGRPTRIEDDGEFAQRTMLRLNIAFGGPPNPAPAYAEPLK